MYKKFKKGKKKKQRGGNYQQKNKIKCLGLHSVEYVSLEILINPVLTYQRKTTHTHTKQKHTSYTTGRKKD